MARPTTRSGRIAYLSEAMRDACVQLRNYADSPRGRERDGWAPYWLVAVNTALALDARDLVEVRYTPHMYVEARISSLGRAMAVEHEDRGCERSHAKPLPALRAAS